MFLFLFYEQYSTCIFISCSKKESSGRESLSVVATDSLCKISGCGGEKLRGEFTWAAAQCTCFLHVRPVKLDCLRLLFEVYLFTPCKAGLPVCCCCWRFTCLLLVRPVCLFKVYLFACLLLLFEV